MRLTLRTMLAYLDDILDSEDSDELGKKIDESKFASDLVHRIRNSTRRLRLGAPKPEGKGMGLDPNTVAEYLDNTLAPEHVPDFEKVCLESDVHLAEVASCHQILTLVLGEPADVEHAIRERIYGVGLRNAEPQRTEEPLPHLASLLVQEAMPTDEGRTGALENAAAIGTYSSRFPVKSVAVTVVLTFLLALIGLRAMGEFNSDHPLRRLFSSDEPLASAAVEESQVSIEPDSSSSVEEPGPETTAAAHVTTAEPTESEEGLSAARVDPGETAAELEEKAGGDVSTPSSAGPSSTASPAVVGESIAAGVETGGGPSAGGSRVGRFLSDDQVMVRYDASEEVWLSLPTDADLSGGDELVVLPTYRPQAILGGGLKVSFVGAARLRLGATGEPAATQLSLVYGRLLIAATTDTGASIRFDLGERQVAIGLPDMDSVAAVEVRRFLAPGADPETTHPQLVVRVYGLAGRTAWFETGPEPILLGGGQLLTALDSETPELHATGSLPPWATGASPKQIHLRGAGGLRKHIAPDRPLIVSLMEQTESELQRQVEVRALANRSLVLFGVYDAVLKTLEDRSQRSYWADHFEMLRFAVSQGSESAAKLQRIVDVAYGSESSTLFKLIRGYSPDQLAAGAAEELVHLLGHSQMGVRVLAALNLKSITNKTHLFLPSKEPGQSRGTVAAWRRSLEEGRIAYQAPPTPLPERVARPEASGAKP